MRYKTNLTQNKCSINVSSSYFNHCLPWIPKKVVSPKVSVLMGKPDVIYVKIGALCFTFGPWVQIKNEFLCPARWAPHTELRTK